MACCIFYAHAQTPSLLLLPSGTLQCSAQIVCFAFAQYRCLWLQLQQYCEAQVVQYYERCARTNNHTTREAACACWGELGTKIEAAAVQPHVPRILCALTASLKDDTWNVSPCALYGHNPMTCKSPVTCSIINACLDTGLCIVCIWLVEGASAGCSSLPLPLQGLQLEAEQLLSSQGWAAMWQVRGAACIASGQVARAFPAESAAFVDSIFPLWVGNLDDNVFSVRQDAAAAIGDFASAHGEAAWERVLPVLGYVLYAVCAGAGRLTAEVADMTGGKY